jgi:flagellar biosynthesis chaperone FliJ
MAPTLARALDATKSIRVAGDCLRRRFWLVASTAALVCLAPVAQAQVYNTGPAGRAQQMPRIYAPYLATIGRVKLLENQRKLGSVGGARTGATGTKGDGHGGGGPVATTIFRPVAAAFVPKQLALRLGKTPQERHTVETTLTDCLNHYTEIAQQKGVPLHDVARARSYFIATNYYIYTAGQAPTLPQIHVTEEQLRANMIDDETFRHMTDRQKQEAYETLIVLAGFADMGFGTMKHAGNQPAAEQFRAFARQNLENLLSAPIEKIHFTDEGLKLD